VYQIQCKPTGKVYVGSSYRVFTRWYAHRRDFRSGTHANRFLQRAWAKYGEAAFDFSVLEECSRDEVLTREQFYIDTLKPQFNISKIAGTPPPQPPKTHCPRGHEYTPENSYFGKRPGDKRCKQCNAERIAARIAAETPEQTAARLAQGRRYLARNRELKRQKAREYAAAHREHKRAYDKAYKAARKAMGPPKPPKTGKDRIRAALAARGTVV